MIIKIIIITPFTIRKIIITTLFVKIKIIITTYSHAVPAQALILTGLFVGSHTFADTFWLLSKLKQETSLF